MNASKSRPGQLMLISLPMALNAVLASAQTQDRHDEEGRQLEEVVVSAQRREESLQSVPISITALSSDDVAKLGMEDVHDIAAQVPNVQVSSAGQFPTFTIRGVTMRLESDNNEPPVAYYRDDVYRGTHSAQMGQLFDVDRVEVLRGPQGTLFGRNATGGLVHIISRRPTDTFEGYAEARVGSWGSDFDQLVVEGAIGGPLSERVRGRLSFKYNDGEGWQKGCTNEDCTNPLDVESTDVLGVRGQLETDLSSNATLLLTLEYIDQKNTSVLSSNRGTADPVTFEPCSRHRIAANQCVDYSGWTDPVIDPKKLWTLAPEIPNNLELWSPTARLEWHFNGFDLTSITAYEDLERFRVDEGLGGLYWEPSFEFDWKLDAQQFTQEIRLNGGGEKLKWIAGAFYYDDRKKGFVGFPSAVPVYGTAGLQDFWEQDNTSAAVFGQADWHFAERWTLTTGLRYTDEDKELRLTDDIEEPTFAVKETFSSGKTTGRLAIDWQATDDVMAYASVTTGFKSAAFNAELVTESQTAPVEPEELTSYELGVKSTLWEHRLRLNVGGYYYDYNGIQMQAVLTNPDTGFFIVKLLNIGDAEIYGLEAELTAQVTDNLEARLGLGLADSEIMPAPGVILGDEPVDGNKIPDVPGTTVNGLVRYHIPLGAWGDSSLQADFTWQDESEGTFENKPEEKIDARGIVNVRANWNSTSGKYYASLFVENVQDKVYNSGWNTGLADSFAIERAYWYPPRSYGARFGVKF